MEVSFNPQTYRLNVLKKFYMALIDAIILQGKIESIIRKYNQVAIYNEVIRQQVRNLSLKLNNVVCQINDLKKQLNETNKKV